MRIAVTYQKGQVFQHFGHTERFKVYDIENNAIVIATTINTNGSSRGALPDVLKKIHVDTLICGNIGSGAKETLSDAKIKLYSGVSGNADRVIEAFLDGHLQCDQEKI